MKGRQTYLGVALVAIVLLVTMAIGGRVFQWGIGRYALGIAVATAAIALVLYRERRDPALLLVGVGASAAVLPTLVVGLVSTSLTLSDSGWWVDLRTFSSLIGLGGLAANLLFVVPWHERRGRPPLRPRTVVAATAVLLLCLVVLVVVLPRPEVVSVGGGRMNVSYDIGLGWAAILIGLVAAGLVVTVHSLSWSGRYGWAAAAGLAIAAAGVAWFLALAGWSLTSLVGVWAEVGPTLALASLLVFVLLSLQLETSRMRRATDRAAEVMEGRAEIAATIAHDVRGPVGTIKGLATTTRKSYDRLDDAQRVEFIGMIESESARLLRLVDQVAVGLKVDAGTLDLTRRLQEIAPLVQQAIERVEAGDRTIQVDAPPDVRAAVDTRWFVEAVAQGLDNALRFSPEERAVRVEVRKGPDDGAIVTVTDLGPGIPSDQREAVFDKFVRWRPTGYEDRQGAGLGLFICRGIARAHGGDATLDSPPAGGTMLRVRFPREGGG